MDDELLFDWIRFYAAFIVLFFFVGVGAAYLTYQISPKQYEASTVVIQTGSRISARQLGSVARALFETATVYEPAAEELASEKAPGDFFRDHTDLRPVPESNTLIVVGRDLDQQGAEQVSSAVAESLVDALNEGAETPDFFVFSGPQPSPVNSQPSFSVTMVVGAMTGLSLGAALAVIHFRLRRPMLSLERALEFVKPDGVVLLDSPRPHWLGFLRRASVGQHDNIAAQSLLRSDGHALPASVSVVAPGFGRRSEAQIERRFTQAVSSGRKSISSGVDLGIIAAHAGTGLRDLGLARLSLTGPRDERAAARVGLVWLR